MSPRPSSLSHFKLRGLIAATFTPFRKDGSLDVRRVGPMVDAVIAQGASGLYVCGSTGEGPLLTASERRQMAEAAVDAARRRVPVIIQVGHNSIEEAREAAVHAQKVGADAISATPPGYFKPQSMKTFIDCIQHVASGAPKLPFYYYHIPVLSGVRFDMVDFLRQGERAIPNLRGIKFSDPTLHEMQACIAFKDGAFDILFGIDEMLLGGLAFGAKGAVGSTFNFAAPLYHRIIAAFETGDLAEAQRLQAKASEMVRILISSGTRDGLKAAMEIAGNPCGISRLPTVPCSAQQRQAMAKQLRQLGFFDWAKPAIPSRRLRRSA